MTEGGEWALRMELTGMEKADAQQLSTYLRFRFVSLQCKKSFSINLSSLHGFI
jgi:hypothetical protein